MSSILARLAARPRAVVLALGLLLLLSGNWVLPLLDRDEPRFAEAGREMLQRHDWIIPWFNGDYRFDKPPLIYWCETVFYRLLGESDLRRGCPGFALRWVPRCCWWNGAGGPTDCGPASLGR